MSDQLITRIGKKIRRLRKQAGYKLVETADKAGVSKGLLSKVENGRTVPSLPVLLSIIQSLGLEPESFFQNIKFEPPQPYYLIKSEEQKPIQKEEDAKGFSYEFILEKAFENFIVEILILEVLPGASRKKVSTDAFELKYVLKGEIDYQIGEEIVKLKKGDTFFYDGRTPHLPQNKSDKPARMLVIYLYDNKRDS
jgi:transcriptional regulator with XRE-family HTH domain